MAANNIQETPEDDSMCAMRSNLVVPKIQSPVVSVKQYGIVGPQIAKPYVQANYPQQGPPPQYIQYIPQQSQIPVQPQQIQNQQHVNVQPPTPELDHPLIQNEGPIILSHDLINRAGGHEQKYFHSRVLGQFAFTNLCAVIVMAITSTNPQVFSDITWNIQDKKFTVFFYLSIVGFIVPSLVAFVNLKKQLNKLQKNLIISLWSFSYIMIFQGVFSSSHRFWYWNSNYDIYVYREHYGEEVLYSLILVVVQILSILAALHTQKEIKYQNFSFYIIPSAAVFELVIYNVCTLYAPYFYWISFFSSILTSYYFIFLILKINKTGLLKRKTSETILAPIFWFATMLFPFYDNEQ